MADEVDASRRSKYLQQTTEQFAALDKHVQEFELVCLTLRYFDNGFVYTELLEGPILARSYLKSPLHNCESVA